MLNYIWFGMLFFGFVYGIFNGRVESVTAAAMDSAKAGVNLGIELLGVMCLWTGLMRIAEKSGLISSIAKALKPVMKRLFPGIPSNHPALGAVVMNMSANFFGLGNAATPFGLKAMNELQKLNQEKSTATDAMCMFLVINTAAVQLVPATVIALRAAGNASNPADIMGTTWVASICAAIAGVISVKLFGKIFQR